MKYKKQIKNSAVISEELRRCAETIAETDEKMLELRRQIEAE